MRSIARQLGFIMLVGAFFFTWRAQTAQDVVGAQAAQKPVKATRLYTGADGMSHAEEVELAPNDITARMGKATEVTFRRLAPSAPNPTGGWHVGPMRQYVITLSGTGEVEVAGGVKVPIGPGNINLIEDLTGKGHITRNFGPEGRLTVFIPLADQKVEIGPMKK
jgi:quercetin dioxygenase-like cupin family protein